MVSIDSFAGDMDIMLQNVGMMKQYKVDSQVGSIFAIKQMCRDIREVEQLSLKTYG